MRFFVLIPLSTALLFLAPDLGAQSAVADSLRARATTTYRQKAYAESTVAFTKLAARGDATPVDLYNAACSAALAGDSTSAFGFLDRALIAGFDSYDQVKIDSDLESLRASAHWSAIIARLDSLDTERKRVLAALPDPFKAFGALADSGYLTTLLKLDAMRRDHADAPMQWRSMVGEALGWTRTMVGDVAGAIAVFDPLSEPATDSPAFDAGSYTPRDAVNEILERARATRLVMINEAHHVAMHRALTTQLLDGLWKQGFRYLAVEAVGKKMSRDTNATPTLRSGTYTKDPVFADMLRAAVRLGFTVVPYDSFAVGCVATPDDPAKCFSARDSLAAAKLYREVFAHDPGAKVIVHAGYSHVVEVVRSPRAARPVAYWLARLTGIDPLTVDQTVMYGHSSPVFEPSEYRAVASRGWLSAPVVLRAKDGSYYRSPAGGFSGVDMQVFTPPDSLVDGRPGWLFTRLGRRRVQIARLPDGTRKGGGPYLVQAFVRGERPDAIPFDQAVTTGGPITLALEPGRYEIHVIGADGEIGHSELRVR
ncbi:MAG: TPR end-of-group domain-containing protein [Gemmatimonadaceae bacterium]